MIRKAVVLFMCLAAILFAQNDTTQNDTTKNKNKSDTMDEMIYREGKRLKASAITSLSLGTAITATGIAMTVINYNNFKEGGNRSGEKDAKSKERGGYAAGGLITAMGIGVNLTAIPIFRRRARMLQDAGDPRFSLIAKPNGVTFVAAF